MDSWSGTKVVDADLAVAEHEWVHEAIGRIE